MQERLNKAGAQLVSLSESIDTTTAAGRMIFTILGAVNQFEREVTAERTSAVALYRLEKGEYIGGAVPYGLSRDGERTVPNADEQTVIPWIKAQAGKGRGASSIATELNREGITCRGSKECLHRAIGIFKSCGADGWVTKYEKEITKMR